MTTTMRDLMLLEQKKGMIRGGAKRQRGLAKRFGKQSASASSRAGAMHNPGTSGYAKAGGKRAARLTRAAGYLRRRANRSFASKY